MGDWFSSFHNVTGSAVTTNRERVIWSRVDIKPGQGRGDAQRLSPLFAGDDYESGDVGGDPADGNKHAEPRTRSSIWGKLNLSTY